MSYSSYPSYLLRAAASALFRFADGMSASEAERTTQVQALPARLLPARHEGEKEGAA